MRKKILVAMSGGVDSSAAALLLKQQGHETAGMTMFLQQASGTEKDGHCGAQRACEDARRVCDHLGIQHTVVDFSQLLQRHVIDNFLSEYHRGRTPNPCIRCNRFIKFGALLEKARELGFDFLATGHYAAAAAVSGRMLLKCGLDSRKDQSYFLYAVAGAELASCIFPLAGLKKTEVRALARDSGLPVAEKPESQDICFIPDGDYRRFFSLHHEQMCPGDIVDTAGKIRGRHTGLAFYTVGQRSGLGIAAPAPLYVIALDAEHNRLVIGEKKLVLARRLLARQLVVHQPELPARGLAKIRYAHRPAACSFTVSGDCLDLVFDEPQEAITPGQSVVVYDNDYVMCGGIIEEVKSDRN